MRKFTPLHSYFLVKTESGPNTTKAGIFLPSTVKRRGEGVIVAGADKNGKGPIPVGANVLFNADNAISTGVETLGMFLVNYEDIYATFIDVPSEVPDGVESV